MYRRQSEVCNHFGAKVITDSLGRNGWEGKGKLCVAEVTKIIKAVEKTTRNDWSGDILEHTIPGDGEYRACIIGIRQLLALVGSVQCERRSLTWEAAANLQVLQPPAVRDWNNIGASLHFFFAYPGFVRDNVQGCMDFQTELLMAVLLFFCSVYNTEFHTDNLDSFSLWTWSIHG